MFRRWSFSITLKELLKNSNPLQSYGQNSNLSPIKPPYEHLGGGQLLDKYGSDRLVNPTQ